MSTSLLASLGIAQAAAPLAKASDTDSERSKIVLKDGVPLKVSERQVTADEVTRSLATAARLRSVQDYQAMSGSAQAIIDPELVDHDEVARRLIDQANGPAATAGSAQALQSLEDSHDFYLFRIAGDVVGSAEQAQRTNAPYPTRLISHESQRASLRVIRENAAAQGGKTTFVNLFQTSDFFLQSVNESSKEKVQIVEVFGPEVLYFFDEQPRVWTFSGVMYNAKNVNHANAFWQDYRRELRGTRLAEAGARAYLSYDKQILEGYLLSFDLQRTADLQHGTPFSFTMFIRSQHFINALGDKGERTMDEQAMRAMQTGEYRAYEQGEDPFTTAQWVDRETEIDPMSVESLAQLEESDKGSFAADGNSGKQLAAERFLLSHETPLPLAGFVALSKDPSAGTQSELASVEVSDPLSDEACLTKDLRALVAGPPEGLITVPSKRDAWPDGQGPPQELSNWTPSRGSAIKRVIVLDSGKPQNDAAVLEALASGQRGAVHYFVARGDSAHPSLEGTQLRDGQIIQLVQEKYTAHLMGQIPADTADPLPDDACVKAVRRLLQSETHFIAASHLDPVASTRRFKATFTDSQARQIRNVSPGQMVRAGYMSRRERQEGGRGAFSTGSTRTIVSYAFDGTVEDVLSSRSLTEDVPNIAEKMIVNLLGAKGGVMVGQETLPPWAIMSIVATLLYEETRFQFEGEGAIGEKTAAGSRAGIAGLLRNEAAGRFGMDVTKGVGGTGYTHPSRLSVRFSGNVVPARIQRYTSGGQGGGDRERGFLPDGAYTWKMEGDNSQAYDLRFSLPHAVAAAFERFVILMQAMIATPSGGGIRSARTLADAVAFAIAAWRPDGDGNQNGIGDVYKARKAAAAANSDGGARYCATYPADDPARWSGETKRPQFVRLVLRRIDEVLSSRPDGSEAVDLGPSRVTRMDPLEANIDAGTVYVMINGPLGAAAPYTKKQVCAATALINNIACRNTSVQTGDKVLGRKHVGGVVNRGDELTMRYTDPETTNSSPSESSLGHFFDFGDPNDAVQSCSLKTQLRDESLNAEKTQKGAKNNWWVEPS